MSAEFDSSRKPIIDSLSSVAPDLLSNRLYDDVNWYPKPILPYCDQSGKLEAAGILPSADLLLCGTDDRSDASDKAPASTIKTAQGEACLAYCTGGNPWAMGSVFKQLPTAERKTVIEALNNKLGSHIAVKEEAGKLLIERRLTDKGRSSGSERITIDLNKLENGHPKVTFERKDSLGEKFKEVSSDEVLDGLKFRTNQILQTRYADALKGGSQEKISEAINDLANSAYQQGHDKGSAWENVKQALDLKGTGMEMGLKLSADRKTSQIEIKSNGKTYNFRWQPDTQEKPDSVEGWLRRPGIRPYIQ